MARLTLVSCAVMVILGVWQVTANSQGNRYFDDVCKNCIVSNGMGFITDPDDCNCYYTCVLVESYKLSSYASQWVSTKRCCPCGMSWSMKLLTCVDFKDKRSTCYSPTSTTNPCAQSSPDALIPRGSPDSVNGDPMCAGFIRCVLMPTPGGAPELIPQTDCCSADQCFDPTNGMCSTAVCNTNTDCDEHGAVYDCLKPSTAQPSECQYTSVPQDVRQFMGKENMITFTCAPGTCWDNDLCACVATNNTAYNDCDRKFLKMYVENSQVTVEDGSGNTVWFETSEELVTTSGTAVFDTIGAYINVGGVANTFLSNTLIVHFDMKLLSTGFESVGDEQCLMGNCLVSENGGSSSEDTISITVERDVDPNGVLPATAEEFHIDITYQEEEFMLDSGSMANVELEVEGSFEVEVYYELWVMFCGDEEVVYAGVLEYYSELLVGSAASASVSGSKQVIMGQSGFVFGTCPSASKDFGGVLYAVNFWRECKPWGVTDFERAYEEILDDF